MKSIIFMLMALVPNLVLAQTPFEPLVCPEGCEPKVVASVTEPLVCPEGCEPKAKAPPVRRAFNRRSAQAPQPAPVQLADECRSDDCFEHRAIMRAADTNDIGIAMDGYVAKGGIIELKRNKDGAFRFRAAEGGTERRVSRYGSAAPTQPEVPPAPAVVVVNADEPFTPGQTALIGGVAGAGTGFLLGLFIFTEEEGGDSRSTVSPMGVTANAKSPEYNTDWTNVGLTTLGGALLGGLIGYQFGTPESRPMATLLPEGGAFAGIGGTF